MKSCAHFAVQIGAYFGWLLSLPLYGPLLQRLYFLRGASPASTLVFPASHALGLVISGLVLSRLASRKRDDCTALNRTPGVAAVVSSLAATFCLVLGPSSWETAALATCGIAGAAYAIPWGQEFTRSVAPGHRAACMAAGMAIANLIYGAFVLLAPRMTAGTILLVSSLLLLLSGCALLLPGQASTGGTEEPVPVPAKGLYLIAAVFIYHLVGGLYYEVTLPQFARLESLAVWDSYYRIVPYLVALPAAVRIRDRFGPPVLALLAVVTMGASYAVLPLLSPSGAYFLSFSFIQIAFAFSDLSLWVGLADYAASAPHRPSPYVVYGAGLCANLVGLSLGGVVASRILPKAGVGIVIGGTLFVTLVLFGALYSLAIAQGGFGVRAGATSRPAGVSREQPPPPDRRDDARKAPLRLPAEFSQQLTARESQVAELLLKGLSNQEIERSLHIAPGTLKTHTSHIYAKLGVAGRQKLLLLALGEEQGTKAN